MIRIDPIHLKAVESATKAIDLHDALQKAVQLEHSTIPPYLVAAYSLKDGPNSQIKSFLIAIAKDEMLHMAILANILLAIGGMPRFDTEDFIPKYPGMLPMGVGQGLTVGLRKFSKELVQDVFMQIEAPENPLDFPVITESGGPTFATIGQFYGALKAALQRIGDAAFVGDPKKQVIADANFPSQKLYVITDVATATKALDWIIEEGEGTPTSPLDQEADAAHYYRFAEIFHGRALVKGAQYRDGYAYAGEAIPFNPADVFDIPDDAKTSDYAPGTVPRNGIDAFNRSYSDMLRALQVAYTSDPQAIQTALADMGTARRIAASVIRLVGPDGRNVPLTFEYTPPAES